MEIDGFLADSVASAEGKLYALGAGWNTITTQYVPFSHPRIGIGLIVRVPWSATNQPHDVAIRLEDADGQLIAVGERPPGPESPDGRLYHITATFNLGRPPHLRPGDDQVLTLGVNIDRVTFTRGESYRFVISVDGVDSKSLPLRVVEATSPRTP